MWQVRVDPRDQRVHAVGTADDAAWLVVRSEMMVRFWTASLRPPMGWHERAWLHEDWWILDHRFTGPRTILRELVVRAPLPRVRVVRLLRDLEDRGAIEPVVGVSS